MHCDCQNENSTVCICEIVLELWDVILNISHMTLQIELKNTTIPEFPTQSFGSSAARIWMESVEVRAIRSGAFSANTYNIVMAVNCSFHLIEEESFAPKSLINNLYFIGCKIEHFTSRALQSAVSNLNITLSK